MPKRVDHQQRQREIAEALWRVAAGKGLPAATLRAVAAEAGISMNLVQYYFPAKDEMLRFAWLRVVELLAERADAGVDAASKTGDIRAVVRAHFAGILPSDERSRMLSAVQIAYFAADVTDAARAAERDQLPQYLSRTVADLLREAQVSGRVDAGYDCELEADALVAMTAGLVSGILVDVYTLEHALRLVDLRLGQLFSGDEPG